MRKEYPTIGCCGIDCGLCPRYYTEGSSRCPGCAGENFQNLHPACSFITCCVKKRGLEVCAQCEEYPCGKFSEEMGSRDSFVTHRRIFPNQELIRTEAISGFLVQQGERMELLRKMLADYNDGRSKSLYCLAAALLSIPGLSKALSEADQQVKAENLQPRNIKSRAANLKQILQRIAVEENVVLNLKPGG